jgi:hypothetical protein
MAAVLLSLNQPSYFVCFFTLFVTHFVHNVAATVSYDRKELLDVRTAITHLELDEGFCFIESDAKDILLCQDQGPNPHHQHEDKMEEKGKEGGVPCKNSQMSR